MFTHNTLVIAVLVLAGLACAWLYWYVRIKLPAEFEAKCRASVSAFSTAVETRSPLYLGMADRIARISRVVARRRGFPRSAIVEIELAGHLRGIGICALPFKLLNVPHPNEWSMRERQRFESHPQLSAMMVDMVPALQKLRPLIHNEDGVGRSLIAKESKDILDFAAEYVWLERWEGQNSARRKILSRAAFASDPQIVHDLVAVISGQPPTARRQT